MEVVLLASKVSGWAINIYFWMHIVAFLISWVNADPSNPFVSFVNRWTWPLWHAVGERCPSVLRPLSSYLALMLIVFAEIFVPGLILSFGAGLLGEISMDTSLIKVAGYFLISGVTVLSHLSWFVFLLSAIWFFVTLVNSPVSNPLVQSLYLVMDPLLTPIQRLLPRMSVDISPLIIALVAYLSSGFFRGLIPQLGMQFLA